MKKFFAFAAAAVMMFSASAETLDLYADATEFLGSVPFNSLWLDTPGYKSQVMYPAADLTAMVGKDIKAITFYTEPEGLTIDGGVLNISLGETDATVMSGFITEGMTPVGTCTFTEHAGEVVEYTITFDTPYRYNGGSLIFESVVATATSMSSTYWTGKKITYDNCAQGQNSATAQRFLPKTTFTYGDDTPEPQFIRGDVDDNGEVKIGDVAALINYLLNGDSSSINLQAADCDQNNEVKIGDVTVLINFLLSGVWSN